MYLFFSSFVNLLLFLLTLYFYRSRIYLSLFAFTIKLFRRTALASILSRLFIHISFICFVYLFSSCVSLIDKRLTYFCHGYCTHIYWFISLIYLLIHLHHGLSMLVYIYLPFSIIFLNFFFLSFLYFTYLPQNYLCPGLSMVVYIYLPYSVIFLLNFSSLSYILLTYPKPYLSAHWIYFSLSLFICYIQLSLHRLPFLFLSLPFLIYQKAPLSRFNMSLYLSFYPLNLTIYLSPALSIFS